MRGGGTITTATFPSRYDNTRNLRLSDFLFLLLHGIVMIEAILWVIVVPIILVVVPVGLCSRQDCQWGCHKKYKKWEKCCFHWYWWVRNDGGECKSVRCLVPAPRRDHRRFSLCPSNLPRGGINCKWPPSQDSNESFQSMVRIHMHM